MVSASSTHMGHSASVSPAPKQRPTWAQVHQVHMLASHDPTFSEPIKNNLGNFKYKERNAAIQKEQLLIFFFIDSRAQFSRSSLFNCFLLCREFFLLVFLVSLHTKPFYSRFIYFSFFSVLSLISPLLLRLGIMLWQCILSR